jgi:hypothetical protein
MKIIYLKSLKRLPKTPLWQYDGKSLDLAVEAYMRRFRFQPRVLYRYERDGGVVSWFAKWPAKWPGVE